MKYIHEDIEFGDILAIAARERSLAPGLVEKDYWVTHTLWALGETGFDVWFKGGTSLSKGFGIIERFSEDLDLKIEPGAVTELQRVSSWKSEGVKATAERKAHFERLTSLIQVPGAEARLAEDQEKSWRGANIRVVYPGQHLSSLAPVIKPFVLLEVGSARVTPSVTRDMSSFVHDYLDSRDQLSEFEDNRPRGVRCVHPLVTLLEKLDALHRRAPKDGVEPAVVVRHFEDASRIIAHSLPPLVEYSTARDLAEDMLRQRQLATMPKASDPAFLPQDTPRWRGIREAYAAISPMFWGSRVSLEEACAQIRVWIEAELA